MTKIVTFEDIKLLAKTERGLSTEALQIASVRVMSVLSYIAGEGIFEQKLEREDINAHQVGVLDRKGCHTPLNKFASCYYKRTNEWLQYHPVSTARD